MFEASELALAALIDAEHGDVPLISLPARRGITIIVSEQAYPMWRRTREGAPIGPRPGATQMLRRPRQPAEW